MKERPTLYEYCRDCQVPDKYPELCYGLMDKETRELAFGGECPIELENEREPIYGEIFDSENKAMAILHFPKSSSLNSIINEDGDELIEFIEGEDEDLDAKEIELKVKEELNKVLDVLDSRERVIIESYFGVNTDLEPMTLEAIGEKYGLTKERIRQIKEKSIRKLRHNAQALQMLINE